MKIVPLSDYLRSAPRSAENKALSRATFSPSITQLVVRHLEPSVTYYQEALGFSLNHLESTFASLGRGAVEFQLVSAMYPSRVLQHVLSPNAPSAYLWVNGFEELYAEYRQSGADIVYPPTEHVWGAVDFCIRDAEGYRLCFARACLS